MHVSFHIYDLSPFLPPISSTRHDATLALFSYHEYSAEIMLFFMFCTNWQMVIGVFLRVFPKVDMKESHKSRLEKESVR